MENVLQDTLNNLRLNENIYLYTKERGYKLTKRSLTKLFSDILVDKLNSKSLLQQKIVKDKCEEKQFSYSILVFRYDNKPSFINESREGWNEVKLAYLLLIEYENYLAISKRNISKLSDLKAHIHPIDSNLLSSLFLNEDSKFEKFSLRNMNISNSAVRNKTLEANNLEESFSSNSSSNYILDSFRISNEHDGKISISLNTAKINKLGLKQHLKDLSESIIQLIEKLKTTTSQESLLSTFAEAISFEECSHELVPIAILINFSKLHSDMERGLIVEILDKETQIDISAIEAPFKQVLPISNASIENDLTDDFNVKINAKSITLSSTRLKDIVLLYNDGSKKTIIDYLNTYSSFIINFDKLDLVYSSRKLFKDNKLLGNIDNFIKTFIAYDELNVIDSEKGNFHSTTSQFNNKSIFNFVETTFMSEYKYFVCDDLGNEWADHIGIKEDAISFFISKYDEAYFSATSFHDIIGQALKNLGNIFPLGHSLDKKKSIWSEYYKMDGVQTQINRLRKGTSVSDMIDFYKQIIHLPNTSKNIYLVINFISKSRLKESLYNLKNGTTFRERNQAIQILWFISTLISGCSDVNTRIFICCKP